VSQGDEIARILPRHVGHAAHLALAPKQLVVVEGRHLVQMNGVDGYHSTLAQSGESADDDLSAGSEGDGAIEFGGRLGVFVAHPGGAERLSGLAVSLAAGDLPRYQELIEYRRFFRINS